MGTSGDSANAISYTIKQCSFHHIMQVLRVCRFSTFALPPALLPCCCPLAFQPQVRRLTSRMSSESSPGYPECVVSCHGAGRPSSSHEGFSVAEAWMQHCWWEG